MIDVLSNGSFSTLLDNGLSFVYYILDFCFSWINIPNLPDEALTSVNTFLDLIFGNLDILSFFVRISTIKFLLGCLITVLIFKYTYRIILWVLRKIPFVGIE